MSPYLATPTKQEHGAGDSKDTTCPQLYFCKRKNFLHHPSFYGASPARVKEGKHAGMRVLADEEDKARKLFRSLSPPQKMAILSDKAPRDILSGQDNTVDRKTFFLQRPTHNQNEPQAKRMAG